MTYANDRGGLGRFASPGDAKVTDAVELSGFAQGSLAVSDTGAHTAALAAGIYDVWCAVDCYIKVGATASDVTTSTGYLLRANNTVPVVVPSLEKLGGITSAASDTLYYHRVA